MPTAAPRSIGCSKSVVIAARVANTENTPRMANLAISTSEYDSVGAAMKILYILQLATNTTTVATAITCSRLNVCNTPTGGDEGMVVMVFYKDTIQNQCPQTYARPPTTTRPPQQPAPTTTRPPPPAPTTTRPPPPAPTTRREGWQMSRPPSPLCPLWLLPLASHHASPQTARSLSSPSSAPRAPW